MADYLTIDSIRERIPNRLLDGFKHFVLDYNAEWELRESKLYLLTIEVPGMIFGSLDSLIESEKPLFAYWYNGFIDIKALPVDNVFYDTVLSLKIQNGYVLSHAYSLKNKYDPTLIEEGRYNGYTLGEIVKPSFLEDEGKIPNYINTLINFLNKSTFHGQIITPYFQFTKEEREFLKKIRSGDNVFHYVTDRYIFIDSGNSYHIPKDEIDNLFKLITKILSGSFLTYKLLFRNRGYKSYYEPRSTTFLNPDLKYAKEIADILLRSNDIENAAKEHREFWQINPHLLVLPENITTDPYQIIEHFEFKRISPNILEYKVILKECLSCFGQNDLVSHKSLFENYFDLIYDEERKSYVFDTLDYNYIIGRYLQDVTKIYNGFSRNYSGPNYYDPSMDESYNSGFEKHNDAYGFNDDTIDNAFEGDPENYWNID